MRYFSFFLKISYYRYHPYMAASSSYGRKRSMSVVMGKGKRRMGSAPVFIGGAVRGASMYTRARPILYTGSYRPETKYFDCGINATVTTAGATWADTEVPCDNYVTSDGTTGAYTNSCLIPTAIGSGYGQVNGNRFKLKKLRIRGVVKQNVRSDQANAPQAGIVRIVLVMDKQPNGAQAQGEDIFQDFGATAENLFAFMNVSACSGRFRILADRTVILQPAVAASDNAGTTAFTNTSAPETKMFKLSWKPKRPMQVNIKAGSSTPTIASTVDCNIFLLVFGVDENGAAASTIQACSRCYYAD